MRQLLQISPDAADIKWRPSEAGWTACFKTNTVESSINFDRYADCKRVFNRYFVAPEDIQKLVAARYRNYLISSVYSVVSYDDVFKVMYSIVIRKENDLKVLSLSDGNLTVFADLGGSL